MKLRTTKQVNGWQVSKDVEARQATKGSIRTGKTNRIIRTACILENIESQFIKTAQYAKISEAREERASNQRNERREKRVKK